MTNPDDFLKRYEGIAHAQAWNDETKCLEFQNLLQGVTREWFSNLLLPLVTSYNDLRACFLLNFHNMRTHKRTHVECHDIRQGTRESLGQFIDRCTKEVAKMAGLPESQKCPVLCTGCIVPDTLVEAINEENEHMRAREDTTRNSGKNPDGKSNKDDDSYRSQAGGSKRKGVKYSQGCASSKYNKFQKLSNSDQGKGHFPSQNFAIMRELTKTPKEILATEPICLTLFAPAKMSEYARRDKSKYCEFHDDYGHEIDRCKSFIEKVIECLRRGELNHLKTLKKQGTAL
ncbi:uncharacterized protein [Rutidosis leptorrhynchoides]|uniref:uncharacterized protein n=1 Tax=Rutidosis leptorrhynchoides TaxID=125765 RepID=UPI003A995AFC